MSASFALPFYQHYVDYLQALFKCEDNILKQKIERLYNDVKALTRKRERKINADRKVYMYNIRIP